MKSTFTPKQNHLPLCPSPIGEASLFIVVGNRLRFSDAEIGRLHSRPAALLGTVALCIRFAERWGGWADEQGKRGLKRREQHDKITVVLPKENKRRLNIFVDNGNLSICSINC